MRLLFETHLLLWALAEPARLGAELRKLIEDPENEVLFSAASIWEVAIKAGLGRVDFAVRPDEIAQGAVAAALPELPPHHRDPFDRLLVAQAMAGPLRLDTADPLLPPYSELITLVG